MSPPLISKTRKSKYFVCILLKLKDSYWFLDDFAAIQMLPFTD